MRWSFGRKVQNFHNSGTKRRVNGKELSKCKHKLIVKCKQIQTISKKMVEVLHPKGLKTHLMRSGDPVRAKTLARDVRESRVRDELVT